MSVIKEMERKMTWTSERMVFSVYNASYGQANSANLKKGYQGFFASQAIWDGFHELRIYST